MYLSSSEVTQYSKFIVRRCNEAIDSQDVHKIQSGVNEIPGESSQPRSVMFLEEDEIAEGETEAAFKRSADEETLNKQQRMHYDIETCTSTKVIPTTIRRKNSDFPLRQKASRKPKKKWTNSKSKALSEALGQRVVKFDLMNSLAQASAGITFGQIARCDAM